MVNFWRIVNDTIFRSDILLLVMDSRFPEETRNREIEMKIVRDKKKILYVLNKSDLVTIEEIEKLKKKFKPCVFVSVKKKFGQKLLLHSILELSRGEPCTVGVLGFPNVGKSSVINFLRGKAVAKVSNQAGYTRGRQRVRAKRKLMLIDTPGVLEFSEKNIDREVEIGSRNPKHLKEPEYFAMRLIEKYPNLISDYYETEYNGEPDEFLDIVAKKKNILSKGGIPDVPRLSRQMVFDWQVGAIHEKRIEKLSKNKDKPHEQ
ncbi:MAG: 50S ribosome-binding GTPase [Nanoarchaeota archaeon]|nr:50S ribosome-binding GTPase [Nanoarchaeota archaeon]